MKEETLEALLKPLIRQCTELIPTSNDSATVQSLDSKFGGTPYAEQSEQWPECPTCKQGLTFICQINSNKCKHEVKDCALYTFYYCWECFPWGLSDEQKGQWIVKRYEHPNLEKLTPIQSKANPEYVVRPCEVTHVLKQSLPDWQELESFSREAARICCEINSDEPWEIYDAVVSNLNCLDDYATVVNGYPRWVQGDEHPNCLVCGKTMETFAQIDTEDEADIMWGDVGCVYLFRCAEHQNEFRLELQCH